MTAGIVVEMLASNPRIIPDRKGSEGQANKQGAAPVRKGWGKGKRRDKKEIKIEIKERQI